MQRFEPKMENGLETRKRIAWNETMRTLDRIVDRLGKPIDAGIKEVVTGFIANDVPTCCSCEGHVIERFGKFLWLCPYVEVGVEEPSVRFIGEATIRERIAAEFHIAPAEVEQNKNADKAYWDYLQTHNVAETSEYIAVREKNEQLEMKMVDLLQRFYEDRQTGGNIKIVIKHVGPDGHFRITTPQGGSNEVKVSQADEYREKLSHQQREMLAFGDFLKRIFFQSS